MKLKQCGICLNEYPALWKARTKDNPAMCRTCALKSKGTPIGNYTMIKISDVVKDLVKEQKIKISNPVNPKEDKSIPELIKLATIVFNKSVKQRQMFNGKGICMACEKLFDKSYLDASHLFNAKQFPSVRFDEDNVHLCCIECNRYLEGNLAPYRLRLEDKIGHIAMGELKERAMVKGFKWDKQELLDIISKYK